ncbi:YafY family transcriptional regulator [Mucilaginibacter daejeonensis]|uniref:helix-turn-helix transcriptional regulator n=1 Tax=Mucilaginibacter daejeonensis TaxID=398049 RepID=UPI001D175744|nr:YafY family protein [Mucilaginibacter daejeonensis]UEG53607.1 YafY family transcriptional regulator [Mucilaginibacter daejeonensis]
MNRIDRISAILIHLQSRRLVKAQAIADRFGISLRTVYRDIRTLEEAGVPIIGEAGVGYSLADGYRLPPVAFTLEEAMAFITAEKLVEKLTDDTNSSSYRSAMYKVRAVLRNAEKDHLAGIDNSIEVMKGNRPAHLNQGLDPLQTLLNAIALKKVVSLTYFSYYRQQHSQRDVEPIGVFYLDRYWHLIAYCRAKQDHRDFRFDRMMDLKVTDECYTKEHPPLKDHLQRVYDRHELIPVVIRIDKASALYLGEQRYYMGYVSEVDRGDELEMTFMTMSLEGFARWYMMFADRAEILEPPALLDKVKGIAQKIFSKA